MFRTRAVLTAALTGLALIAVPATANAAGAPSTVSAQNAATTPLTVATMDADLSRNTDGELATLLRAGDDTQALRLAATVQAARPDVLVLTGIDVDASGDVVTALREQYLSQGQDGREGIDYEYAYAELTNKGVPSGADLDNDGQIGGAGDALGRGDFESQSSMLVLSRLPIDRSAVRTFDNMTWASLPGNQVKQAGYSATVSAMLPLQSASVWDIPFDVSGTTVHVVATEATSAVGEDGLAASSADQLRQQDQMRFLREYVTGSKDLRSIQDDQGREGPLGSDADVVVAGDLGAQTGTADASSEAVQKLGEALGVDTSSAVTTDPGLFAIWGAPLRDLLTGDAAATRTRGQRTGRYDYVLPSSNLSTADAGLTEDSPEQPTRLVWTRLAV